MNKIEVTKTENGYMSEVMVNGKKFGANGETIKEAVKELKSTVRQFNREAANRLSGEYLY